MCLPSMKPWLMTLNETVLKALMDTSKKFDSSKANLDRMMVAVLLDPWVSKKEPVRMQDHHLGKTKEPSE